MKRGRGERGKERSEKLRERRRRGDGGIERERESGEGVVIGR